MNGSVLVLLLHSILSFSVEENVFFVTYLKYFKQQVTVRRIITQMHVVDDAKHSSWFTTVIDGDDKFTDCHCHLSASRNTHTRLTALCPGLPR